MNCDWFETPLTVVSVGSFDALHADPAGCSGGGERHPQRFSPPAEPSADGGSGKISIVIDWPEELKQRLPEKQPSASLFQDQESGQIEDRSFRFRQ